MGGKSNYLENLVLGATLSETAIPALVNLYIALFTDSPADLGGGVEVQGGGYARALAPKNAQTWEITATGRMSNKVPLSFPASTSSWGTVIAFGIYDAATGGNLLYWGDLITQVAIPSGRVPLFAAGDLVVTEE